VFRGGQLVRENAITNVNKFTRCNAELLFRELGAASLASRPKAVPKQLLPEVTQEKRREDVKPRKVSAGHNGKLLKQILARGSTMFRVGLQVTEPKELSNG
jgi:hypothetical protein